MVDTPLSYQFYQKFVQLIRFFNIDLCKILFYQQNPQN